VRLFLNQLKLLLVRLFLNLLIELVRSFLLNRSRLRLFVFDSAPAA
jgi:hypothetical protein